MSVSYDINFEDQEVVSRKENACFGRLRDLDDYLRWEYDVEGPITPSSIDYFMDKDFRGCEGVDSKHIETLYAYLSGKKVFASALIGSPTRECISVTTDVHPHVLLNTLSSFRYPVTYPHVTRLFHNWVNAGLDPDFAFCVASMCKWVDTNKVCISNWQCSEHTVIAPTTFTVESLRRFKSDKLRKVKSITYTTEKAYEHGVANFFSVGGKPSKSNPLLRDVVKLVEKIVSYDKDKKEVIHVSETDHAFKIDDKEVIKHLKKVYKELGLEELEHA